MRPGPVGDVLKKLLALSKAAAFQPQPRMAAIVSLDDIQMSSIFLHLWKRDLSRRSREKVLEVMMDIYDEEIAAQDRIG